MKDLLTEALQSLSEQALDNDQEDPINTIDDLQQSGYLTGDEGLVVTLADGRKFIVTVQEV